MKIKYTVLAFLMLLFLSGCTSGNNASVIETPKSTVNQSPAETPPSTPSATSSVLSAISSKEESKMEIDAKKTYQVVLKTTQGDITIELNTKNTPITSNNFITLAKKKFYDGTKFHRVIKGFMIQGGDPKGDGTGGPGYTFKDEPFEGSYTRGTVAMANAGPNTNGSQFFIMHADYPLPKNYVIFGHVINGLDVVDKIASSPVETSSSGEASKPVTPTIITATEIIEK